MTRHDLAAVADEQYAYLTTTGRVTGQPHEIEIWFSTDGERVHLLSGGGDDADWVRNLRAHPPADLRIAGATASYLASFDLTEAERRVVAERHAAKYSPDAVDRWFTQALFVTLVPA